MKKQTAGRDAFGEFAQIYRYTKINLEFALQVYLFNNYNI